MRNRHPKPVPLPRPGRCKHCNGNMIHETEVREKVRVDVFKCWACGREADQVAIQRRRG